MADYDFISSMPDVILHHILSFLDMHEVVQTCILSKRWTNLWKTLPFLSFNGSHFVKDNMLEEEVRRLEHFVSMVLLRREPCAVLRFHLNCFSEFQNFKCGDVNTWINYAVEHNVRELYFHVWAINLVHYCVLTCTSLEKLNLEYCYTRRYNNYLKGSEVIDLPNLREVVLFGVELENNFLKQLPVLEDLQLEHCILDDFVVSSNTLKHLRIKISFRKPIRKINAPNLISFQFNGNSQALQDTIFEDTSSLVDVCVDVVGSCDFGRLLHNIARIPSVKNLKLLTATEVEHVSGELPLFNQLKGFTFGGYFCIYCYFGKLSKFLERSPNLRKLTLEQYGHYSEECQCNWEEIASYGHQCIDAGLKFKGIKEVKLMYMKHDETECRNFCAWSLVHCN